MVIEMPYLREASVNSYKIVGKGGRHTNATKPSVIAWMCELADRIREHPDFTEYYGSPCSIYVKGFFWDDRAPDVHNFFKVIADAIEPAIGVNDKYLKCIDENYETGHERQKLVIRLETI